MYGKQAWHMLKITFGYLKSQTAALKQEHLREKVFHPLSYVYVLNYFRNKIRMTLNTTFVYSFDRKQAYQQETHIKAVLL